MYLSSEQAIKLKISKFYNAIELISKLKKINKLYKIYKLIKSWLKIMTL